MWKRAARSSTASCANPRLLHGWHASDRPPPNRCARESAEDEPGYECDGVDGCCRRFKDGLLDRSFTDRSLICQRCINDEARSPIPSPCKLLG